MVSPIAASPGAVRPCAGGRMSPRTDNAVTNNAVTHHARAYEVGPRRSEVGVWRCGKGGAHARAAAKCAHTRATAYAHRMTAAAHAHGVTAATSATADVRRQGAGRHRRAERCSRGERKDFPLHQISPSVAPTTPILGNAGAMRMVAWERCRRVHAHDQMSSRKSLLSENDIAFRK